MKINIGDYKIETDERQFIVKAKSIVKESKMTKAENVGKEVWQTVAYFTRLDSTLKYLSQRCVSDNDELIVIKEKIDLIERDIKQIKQALEIGGDDLSIKWFWSEDLQKIQI